MALQRIVVIAGSGRPNSQSERVADIVARDLLPEAVESDVLPLANTHLPMWDEVTVGEADWRAANWTPISQQLAAADAFVVVTPEWHGMVPPQLKNLFVFADNREFAHKPGLIVAVSSGMGGAYPVAELRMSSYKNSRIVWLPDHVIIRKVEDFGDGSANDVRLRERLKTSIAILAEYASRMTDLREKLGDRLKLGSGM